MAVFLTPRSVSTLEESCQDSLEVITMKCEVQGEVRWLIRRGSWTSLVLR